MFNHINGDLYHYAGNNPVKYTDPDGKWLENEDGSYTAVPNDTLWGLSQLTGKDWRDTDYSGIPEDLQVNQTVRFRTEFDLKFEGTKLFLDATANTCTVGSQFLKAMADNGYTAATVTSMPLKLLDDPILLHNAGALKFWGDIIGKSALILAYAYNLYDGINTGIKSNSFLRGAYKTATGASATCLGYLVTIGASPLITPAGGVLAGIGTSLAIDCASKRLEELIWGKQ